MHQGKLPTLASVVLRDPTVGHIAFAVNVEDGLLVQALQEISHAVHNHLVRDDHHACTGVVALEVPDHAAQPQDDITPAFSTRWAKVEFPDQLSLRGQFREGSDDATRGVAVQNTELLLT